MTRSGCRTGLPLIPPGWASATCGSSRRELSAPRGGSLDILAADGDTYYSVEVQLGEVDASHSFRVFDYWARNRTRFEGRTHVAVLVVESAAGRYRPALEALASRAGEPGAVTARDVGAGRFPPGRPARGPRPSGPPASPRPAPPGPFGQ